MTDVHTLAESSATLTHCPVFVADDSGEYRPCGEPLAVIATHTVSGDDYGSWGHDTVAFACGHTLAEMADSIRHADEI